MLIGREKNLVPVLPLVGKIRQRAESKEIKGLEQGQRIRFRQTNPLFHLSRDWSKLRIPHVGEYSFVFPLYP
jgi:hypothetical protein